jgi:hypothetical protein
VVLRTWCNLGFGGKGHVRSTFPHSRRCFLRFDHTDLVSVSAQWKDCGFVVEIFAVQRFKNSQKHSYIVSFLDQTKLLSAFFSFFSSRSFVH